MLPEGFQWAKALQHDKVETAVLLGATEVARLHERLDGLWFVRLESYRGVHEPLLKRDCTSFEQGKIGVELWVQRHEARLRSEVEARRKPRWDER